MKADPAFKIRSLVELFDFLPEDQRIITDVLRQIVLENLPATCKKKITYNVPFFYGKKEFVLYGRQLFPAEVYRKVFY